MFPFVHDYVNYGDSIEKEVLMKNLENFAELFIYLVHQKKIIKKRGSQCCFHIIGL